MLSIKNLNRKPKEITLQAPFFPEEKNSKSWEKGENPGKIPGQKGSPEKMSRENLCVSAGLMDRHCDSIGQSGNPVNNLHERSLLGILATFDQALLWRLKCVNNTILFVCWRTIKGGKEGKERKRGTGLEKGKREKRAENLRCVL